MPSEKPPWPTTGITTAESGRLETWQRCYAQGVEWLVTTEWDLHRGRLEPVNVAVRGNGHAGAVTGEVLRAIPLGSLHQEARAMAAGAVKAIRSKSPEIADQLMSIVPRGIFDLAEGPRRGIAMTDEDLEQIAVVYRNAWAAGRPTLQAVADAFHIATSTANKRIIKARKQGLLDGVGRKAR
jgi:hypothetical protein